MNGLFQRGIELFNREEFFECHEVLEELGLPNADRIVCFCRR